MGFLMGAYGKLLAASRVRSIQARLMNVQSQMRRAARESANMQKYINNQKTQMMNMFKQQSAYAQMGLQSSTQVQLQNLLAPIQEKYLDEKGVLKEGLSDADKKAYESAMANYNATSMRVNTEMSQQMQMLNMSTAQQTQMIENYIEFLNETQLEPLKLLEEDLEQEKLSLESELKLAEQDKEACEKMEDAGAKNLVPKYTGQG